MRHLGFILVLTLILKSNGLSAIIEGSLITQIRGITNQVLIRSSSNPAAEQQPDRNGIYRIDVAAPAQDYVLISPMEGDDNLYSPRVIPASAVGIDTLYIIPPTNPSIAIIVDNKTNRDFRFLADKAIILNELVTSQKDYELTIIPHHSGTHNLLIAGMTPGYPAVVKSVPINTAQRRGILVIEPRDIGIQPPAPVIQQQPRIEPERTIETPPVAEKAPPPIVYIERTPPPAQEEIKREPSQPNVEPEITVQTIEETEKPTTERIKAAQNAYYFSDRLVIKDRRNTSIALQGGYQMYPNMSESTQILSYGLDFYNIKLFKKYFDLGGRASTSEQLPGSFYTGSLTWHHSPYASIDVVYKTAEESDWQSRYDVSQTSVGVNGYYKSQGVAFQLGAGVRFQVDYGDFKENFPEQVENKYRYLQSFYLIGSGRLASSSYTAMVGLVNEALYASAGVLFFRSIGLTYTFKNKNIDNAYFTALEEELQHRISMSINFTLKNREKIFSP